MKIYTPNLAFLKYTGEVSRKLWEARSKNAPILENGDVVLLPEVTAVLLAKRHGFKKLDNQELVFAGESQKVFTIEDMTDEQFEKFKKEYEKDSSIVPADSKNTFNIEIPENMTEDDIKEFENAVKSFIFAFASKPKYTISDEEQLEAILSGLEDGEFKEEDLSEYDSNLLKEHRKISKLDEEDDSKARDEDVTGDDENILEPIKEDDDKDVYKLPTKAELEFLDEEQIKFACKHVGIKTGRKATETLKGLLLAYLPE